MTAEMTPELGACTFQVEQTKRRATGKPVARRAFGPQPKDITTVIPACFWPGSIAGGRIPAKSTPE
ncbi:hypothetical protein [Nocardia huaxiensis]|uniref:Uncharacterized protein n=1 Tax=Nocardia huaxiensis TaxID=2755382 RepID=A0A7D6VA76_9NOCA|nr:hypothetical protein [Nocardia huaxiensis]QLY31521.1 hypothetical protein H0264_04040 [Nocardia huaxiensis]UFS95073.1 hypothetical protein LPY97_30875 [Nocardia huaxiensis]